MNRLLAVVVLCAFCMVFTGAVIAAEKIEIVSKRTEYAKVFDNGDGTYTATIENHPVHKRDAKGEWVDFSWENEFRAKTAVSISNYNTYTSNGSVFYTSSYYSECYTGAGILYPTGDGSGINVRSALLFYLAGIDASQTESAYYVIESPVLNYDATSYVAKLSSNPRWASAWTVWDECGGSAVTSFYMSNSSINVQYASMASDVRDAADSGFISWGHRSDNGTSGTLNKIGTSATLYLTLSGRSLKKTLDVFNISASPNPFNPRTSINFMVDNISRVAIEIYNINGQKVQTLIDGNVNAGRHSVMFDGSGMASGVYFYHFCSGSTRVTGKLLLVK